VALEQQLPQAVQLARAKVCRPAFERGAFSAERACLPAADLGDGDLVDEIELGTHHRHRFDPERVLVGHFLQQGGAIGSQQGGEQATLERLVGKAEHVAHLLGAHADGLALSASGKVGVADRLIEDREPVARRPFGGGGDHGERLVLGLDAFFLADVGEMLREQVVGMRRKSKRWHRESTVTGSLSTSVVANRNFTWAGGSSSVLSKALNALRLSM
jgi:hypothetical protein